MTFEYFYGQQADLYSNIPVPKLLFEREEYRELSVVAKVLYGLLLEQAKRFAVQYKWIDEENRIYVIYPTWEAMKILKLNRKQLTEKYKELERFGLIERRYRGNGLPAVTYVKEISIEMVPD